MANLFQTSKQAISYHLRAIYAEGDVVQAATVKDYLTVQSEADRSVRRSIKLYNLEAILAVGFRVRSARGTQFRQWATTTLREYLIKGFVMNDERLKDPAGLDYFDELLERIREVRASEKRFYQKVRDVFATAVDYEPKTDAAQTFFATVQNKMLYAITGQTAAELIFGRADITKPNMGLTSWKAERVRKYDIEVAKNYLASNEIAELNRIVIMYLDFAEDQARRRHAMTMHDWANRLDAFLRFNEHPVLTHAGTISAEMAKQIAHERYEVFDERRHADETAQSDAEYILDIETLTDILNALPTPKPPKAN
jgi:hypothetical protein